MEERCSFKGKQWQCTRRKRRLSFVTLSGAVLLKYLLASVGSMKEDWEPRKNFNKAFAVFMDGAKQKDADCFYRLGGCFRRGNGIRKNEAKRFK